MRGCFSAILLAGVLASCPGPATAQFDSAGHPLSPADTSSPRATLRSFIDSCNELHALILNEQRGSTRDFAVYDHLRERIFRGLDTSEEAGVLRERKTAEAAVALKEVLDRIELPPDSEIPGPEELAAANEAGRPIKRWRIPNTEIVIARVTDGPREGAYLFDAETVARAPGFYRRVRDLPYKPDSSEQFYEFFLSNPGPRIFPLVRSLPDSLRTNLWGGHAVWKWLGLGIALAIALAIMALTYGWMRRRANRFQEEDNVFRYCVTLVYPTVCMLVPLLLGRFARDELRLSGTLLLTVTVATSILFLLAAMFLIVAAGSRIAAIIISSPKIQPKGLDAQFIRIICRVLSLVGAAIVFLEGGRHLGIPLTTLLASAGVGGLALALAAQDSLKNFFGSMMIILDKPFHIGERIAVKGYDGIVEQIGLRSTKIRLLSGHQATLPNEELARCNIENIGRRPHIRRVTDIRLPSGTPSDKVEETADAIREILRDHEGQEGEFPPRVSINDFNADSINIRFIYWYHPPKYWDFLAHSEKINLRIQRAMEENEVEFAQPDLAIRIDQSEAAAAKLADIGIQSPSPDN